ncbi:Uncharacterised protein [Klebsiella michiganensis]|nr:Uncharacterised protein [Klebsiella michiganensis]
MLSNCVAVVKATLLNKVEQKNRTEDQYKRHGHARDHRHLFNCK